MTRSLSPQHPVLVVVGTRPEAIKLAPVVRALSAAGLPVFLLSTGQHREMLEQMFGVLGLKPDRELGLMRPDQSLAALSASLIENADRLIGEVEPSWVVVQGDTTTVAMVGLAAFYRKVRVAHVEAGLRTHDKHDPFPEEMNRSLLGRIADLHFAPTPAAERNLLAEGVAAERVHVVGNTVIDALFAMRDRVAGRPLADFGLDLPEGRRRVLVTGHRRESFGRGLRQIFYGLARLAEAMQGEVDVVYPVHLNPNVRAAADEVLGGVDGVRLLEPLDYAAFVRLLVSSALVVTDSGGVQEEAAALGIPVLVTRRTSERGEALAAGVAELVGTDADRVAGSAERLLRDPELYAARAVATDAFGDGRSGRRIARILAAEEAA